MPSKKSILYLVLMSLILTSCGSNKPIEKTATSRPTITQGEAPPLAASLNTTTSNSENTGTNKEVSSDLNVFWSHFRNAILSNDIGEIKNFTRFPLQSRGPLDFHPVIEFEEAAFENLIKIYLSLQSGDNFNETNLDFITKNENLDSKNSQGPSDNWARIGNMQFELENNSWRLTFVYLEEESYTKLGVDLNAAHNTSLDVKKISRTESGLDTIAILNFEKYKLNSLIKSILGGSTQYLDSHFKKGIVKESDSLIISERFSDIVIENIKIGTSIKNVKITLGKPSISFKDYIFYKTKHYYLGFKGNKKVEQAVIRNNPKTYYTNILEAILHEFNKDSYTDLSNLLQNTKAISDFFDMNGHINGGGWYADSVNGIKLYEFGDDNNIAIYNNFEGELFTYNGKKGRFDIIYKNEDYIANILSGSLDEYLNINKRFKTEGKLSPSGNLSCIYDWIYSMSQYFTIHTLDFSKPDFRAHATSKEFKWIDDNYILYIHAFNNIPYAVNINNTNSEHINILYKLGILTLPEPDNLGDYDFKIKEIKDNIIVLEDLNIKRLYKIKYAIDGKGSIKFNLLNN
ncbi:MAG TPA: hypothetical protein VIO64_05080 [Pseudobacteroides sp.]|uniref:hypothetical protein n=1 Tax=Pseudobacteroides sp. TaxID=1968840 RepID=UPI002F948690